MWDLDTLRQLNRAERYGPDHYAWRYHPRVVALQRAINQLPVPPGYRARLRLSLYRYAEQLVSRPEPLPQAGWTDLEALQQITLGEALEASLARQAQAAMRSRGGGA
jgi:hypothetical protein